MDAEGWVRLNRLLDEVLDLPVAERTRWLGALDLNDEPLKQRLEALLARAPSVQAAGFLSAIPSLDGLPAEGD